MNILYVSELIVNDDGAGREYAVVFFNECDIEFIGEHIGFYVLVVAAEDKAVAQEEGRCERDAGPITFRFGVQLPFIYSDAADHIPNLSRHNRNDTSYEPGHV
jgi:hypothetical protein